MNNETSPNNDWQLPDQVRVIDSHTGGEPTRVIVAGGPPLGTGTMAERRTRFKQSYDTFRRAVILEPRGGDLWVGALVEKPQNPEAVAGVIFFNNAGYLGMCGHGTIGLMVTLHALGQADLGAHLLETPVGPVKVYVHDANTVTIENVPSYRYRAGVQVDVDGFGPVTGDIAYGGNWFFLVEQSIEPIEPNNTENLLRVCRAIRAALIRDCITGADGGEIDHIELVGPGADVGADSRNFVLCPGGAFDRSPCGTGTSAKLACLAADGKLAPGQRWRQASIVGSVFEGQYKIERHSIIPQITGTAFITAESNLRFQPSDPLMNGLELSQIQGVNSGA